MAQNTDLDEFLGTRPPSRWQRWRKWILLGVGILLVLWILVRWLTGGTVTQYVTQPATRDDLRVTVSATGKLAPINQVTVGSELSGLVIKVLVDVNDRVTVGQPLAILDPAQFKDQVTQTRAALNANQAAVAQMQATLQQDQAQLERLQQVSKLSGGKVPSKVEMDTGLAAVARDVANLRSARANVVSAQASLSSNQTQLYKSVIRSSVNGVVLARQIEPGQTVAASFNTPTLFVIAQDLTQMKLQVAVDEADVGGVRQGEDANFTVDAFPGRSFPAKITRVDLGSNLTAQDAASSTTTSTTTSSQVVSYAATLSVANPDLQLRPGMTATADIDVDARHNVLLVPNAALRFDPATAGKSAQQGVQIGGGGAARAPGTAQEKKIGAGSRQTVYVVGDDKKPKPINVTTGATDGSRTEVTSSALKPGMQVIVGVKASKAK